MRARDGGLVHIGEWHVHPSGATRPSKGDLGAWRARFICANVPRYLGLIGA